MFFSTHGLQMLKDFEGLRLEAYKDIAGIPTIGYGNITYENGAKVKMGDVITKERAERLLMEKVTKFAAKMDWMTKTITLNQNQFDALVLLTYNIGEGAFKKSTVLKRVLKNPNDPSIRDAFMMWNKATIKGVLTESKGLTTRRATESALYFT